MITFYNPTTQLPLSTADLSPRDLQPDWRPRCLAHSTRRCPFLDSLGQSCV